MNSYKANFLIQQQNFLGIKYYYVLSIDKNGIEIRNSYDQVTQFEYKDVIKIFPISQDSNCNLQIQVASKQFEQNYHCNSLNNLIGTYLTALDTHIENSQDFMFRPIQQGFKDFELDQKVTSISQKSYYKVEMKLFRSHFRVSLLHKNQKSSSFSIIFKDQPQDDNNLFYLVQYDQIDKIISTYWGFQIQLKNSNQIFSFNCLQHEKKVKILNQISKESKIYFGIEQQICNENEILYINSFLSKSSINKFFKINSALKINEFKDLIKIQLTMNDSFIYELMDNQIINKIKIENIIKVSESHDDYDNFILSFQNGEQIHYVLKSKDKYNFFSQLQGIIDDQNDQQIQRKNNGILTIGNFNFKDYYINDFNSFGENSIVFENLFIKKLFNKNFKIESNEFKELLYLITINFKCIQVYSIIKVNEFLNQFSKQMNTFFSVKNLIKKRSQNQKEIVLNLFQQLKLQKDQVIMNDFKNNQLNSIDYASQYIQLKDKCEQLIDFNRTLNQQLQQYQVSYQIWEVFIYFFNDSQFYGEIAQNFNSNKKNKNFVLLFQNVLKMFFQENNPLTAYIAGKFLQKFTYYRPSNLKIETLNKNIILNKQLDIDFLSLVAKFLQKILMFGDSAKNFININLIQIEAILDIFLIIVFKKKNSTLQSDLQNLLRLISNAYFFQCFVYFTYTNEPEILFKTSLLMNSIIECLLEREKVQNYQSLILHNSTLLLRHIEFCVSQVSLKQKQSSILLIYHCLIENVDAGALMSRLLPESIFNCVIENYQDTSKWSLNMWEDLFRNLNQDHNTPMLQWNSDTRKELLSIIENEIYQFHNQLKPLQQYRRKIILKEMLMDQKYTLQKDTEEEILQLQWNFEEYHVKYSSLQNKFPVYKYYLAELFNDDSPNPKLTDQNIKNPKKFYDELVNNFIVSENITLKNKILKVLILLYQDYHNRIKDSSFINILIKYLSIENYDSINYLFLQLINAFLNISNKHLAFQNYNRFLDAEGIEIIIQYINRNSSLLDTNHLDYKVSISNYNNFIQEINTEKSESINIPQNKEFSFCQKLFSKNFQMNFCYLKEPLQQEAYNQIYQKSNEIILCIRILKSCINMCKPQQGRTLLMYPKPLAKQIIFQKTTIKFIQNLLLFNNDVLLNEVLDFVNETFLDKFHFKKFIKNKWVVPLLIYKINDNTIDQIGTFLKKILENLIASESYQIVQILNDIKNMKIQAEINDLRIYAPSNQKNISSNIQQVFDVFGGLYYLTPYFWYILMQKGVKKFKQRLMNYSNKGFLVWSEEAFNTLKKKLSEILLPLTDQSFEHEYQPYQVKFSFCEELTCGPLILKNWIIQDRKVQQINLEDCQAFFDMLQQKMTIVTDQIMNARFSINSLEKLLKDLHILMDAQAVLFKNSDKLEAITYLNVGRYLKFYLLFDLKRQQMGSEKDIENFDPISEMIEENNSSNSLDLQKDQNLNLPKFNDNNKTKKSFIKKFTNEDVHISYPVLEILNKNFLLQIKKNYLDLLQFVLINALKLLRYILRPGKTSNKNFKIFITQKELILDLMLLMQDRVNDVIEDSFNFTFNRFKINVSFIGLILNIFEQNGYDLQCFDSITKDKCASIGHILTNLDTNIINVYINFLNSRNQEKEELQDKLTVIDDLKNKAIDEIEKEEGEEIQQDLDVIQGVLERSLNQNESQEKKKNKKSINYDEEISQDDSVQTGSFQLLSPMYIENKKRNYFRVLPLSMKNLMTEKNKKPETEQEKTIFVKIQEIKQCSFKQLVKKLQLEEIKKETAGFDLSRTIIDQKFFEDLKPEYSMIYHEVKNLVHEQLKSWVLIVYKLSKNSKNCEQMIKTGLVNHCFTLSLVYQVKRNFKDQKLFFNINIFAKMCYKAFYNILLFSIMSTLVSNDTENKQLKQKLHSKMFTKLINMSEIIEVDKQFLTSYFQIMQNLFGKEVLTKMFMNNNNYIEKIMKSLGTKEEIISEQKLNKITQIQFPIRFNR